jgi:hypothetical protein
VEIRHGKYSLTELQEWGAQLEAEALAAQANSPLPDAVAREAINELIADVHVKYRAKHEIRWAIRSVRLGRRLRVRRVLRGWQMRSERRLRSGWLMRAAAIRQVFALR